MKKYAILCSALVSIVLTSYFSLLPLGGMTQVDISNLYFSKVTPAGFTFAIWSLIYLSWICLGILQSLGKEKSGKKSIFFSCAILLTTLWLVPWHFNYIGTSFLVMSLIMYILVFLYKKEKYEKYFQGVLELTLGWILVAAITNFHALLIAYDIYFFPITFSIISLTIGLIINIHLIRKNHSYIPAFVLIWALFGIILGQDAHIIKLVGSLYIVTLLGIMAEKYQFSQSQKKKK